MFRVLSIYDDGSVQEFCVDLFPTMDEAQQKLAQQVADEMSEPNFEHYEVVEVKAIYTTRRVLVPVVDQVAS